MNIWSFGRAAEGRHGKGVREESEKAGVGQSSVYMVAFLQLAFVTRISAKAIYPGG